MVAMPIYRKSLEDSSSPEPKVLRSGNLACSIGDSSSTKVYINDDPGLTLTYFMVSSNLVAHAFELGKIIQSHLMGENLQQKINLAGDLLF